MYIDVRIALDGRQAPGRTDLSRPHERPRQRHVALDLAAVVCETEWREAAFSFDDELAPAGLRDN